MFGQNEMTHDSPRNNPQDNRLLHLVFFNYLTVQHGESQSCNKPLCTNEYVGGSVSQQTALDIDPYAFSHNGC